MFLPKLHALRCAANKHLPTKPFLEILLSFFSTLAFVFLYSSLSRLKLYLKAAVNFGFVEAVGMTGKFPLIYQLMRWGFFCLVGFFVFSLLDRFWQPENFRLKKPGQIFLSVGIVHYCPMLTTRLAFQVTSQIPGSNRIQIHPLSYFLICLAFCILMGLLKAFYYTKKKRL